MTENEAKTITDDLAGFSFTREIYSKHPFRVEAVVILHTGDVTPVIYRTTNVATGKVVDTIFLEHAFNGHMQ